MAKHKVQTLLKFIGGVNKDKIGGNCSVVEHTDEKGVTKRVMFDAGSVFTPYGSEFASAFPNLDEYLDRTDPKTGDVLKAPKPIDFLFLTHAHEDHIGALMNYVRMGYNLPPMMAGGFTRNFIRLSFAKEGLPVPEIEKIKAGDVISVGENMKVEAVDVSHSVVDSLGFITTTYAKGQPYATLVNNGDFLTDENMPLGHSFSKEKYLQAIERLKAQTTLLELDSTSTNPSGAERIGFEKAVNNTLKVCQENLDRKIIISPVICRSLQNIAIDIAVARALQTKVFLDGQWLNVARNAMKLSGYSDFEDVVYKGNYQSYLYDKKVPLKYIICSGAFAQGLEDYVFNRGETEISPIAMSAATKMALDMHPFVHISKECLVLARQRIIEPINGKTGPMMYQLMAKQGAKVVMSPYSEKIANFEQIQMQDSGHSNAEAMKNLVDQIHRIVPDVVALPIHGTPEQLTNTKNLMEELKVSTYMSQNLDVFQLEGGKVTSVQERKPTLTWFAVKNVFPTVNGTREVPLDGLKEYWTVTEDYEPMYKMCEVQNALNPGNKASENKGLKNLDLEKLSEMPAKEKMNAAKKGKFARKKLRQAGLYPKGRNGR